MTRWHNREWAANEVQAAIEGVFFAASLLRESGDSDGASRLGDLGDKMHDEYMRLKRGEVPS